jgi:hypothetical protein
MKRALIGTSILLLLGASSVAYAGPQKVPLKKSPKISQKNANKADTYTGVMKTMRIKKDGSIIEIYIRLAGNTRTARVVGCGAKSVDHPLLNWAFQNKRLVHLSTDSSGCFANVEIPS